MVARSLRAATRQLKKRRRGVAPERLAPCEQEGRGGWCEVGLGVEKENALALAACTMLQLILSSVLGAS